LTTHHADSRLSATLPANGAYYVHLGDTQRKGGPEYAYRLRLSSPRPDFELRVAPSSLSLRGGATVPLTVYALRKDGYSNEIALALKGAPAGFLVSGARVPAGQDQVRLTLTAPALPQKEPFTLRLEGRATIGGREVVHPAVPAEDMMQAFAYRHLVPAQEFRVAVSGRGAQWGMVRVLSDTPVKIPVGGTARVRLNVPGRAVADRLDLELSEPPEGVSVKNVVSSGFGTEMVLQSDAAKSKSGLKGNLIVNAFAGKTEAPAKPKALGGNRRVMGTLPAIPFEMVKP
jgi:hypothetical protein